MRKYTPIWNALKRDGHCAIAAHPSLHARIIKAISCEKNRDVGYKLILSSRNRKLILGHKVDGSRIRFFVREHFECPTAIPLEEFV